MNQQVIDEASTSILSAIKAGLEQLDPDEKLEVIRKVELELTELGWQAEEDSNDLSAEDQEEDV